MGAMSSNRLDHLHPVKRVVIIHAITSTPTTALLNALEPVKSGVLVNSRLPFSNASEKIVKAQADVGDVLNQTPILPSEKADALLPRN